MKLNRKGYLTVEVILASVAAIGIAFFLMEITIKLVNTTDDTFVGSEVLTDKALLIDNLKSAIQEDIDNEECEGIHRITSKSDNEIEIQFCGCGTKSIKINGNIVQYGTTYTKKIDDSIYSLKLSSPEASGIAGYKLFKITGDNKFSKNPFVAEIIVYNNPAENCIV